MFFATPYALSDSPLSKGDGVSIETENSGIRIFPKGTLFNVENMMPGQEISTDFVVSSNRPYDVYLSALLERGNVELFENVVATVKNGAETFYKGSFAKLKDLSLKFSKGEEEKNLKLVLFLPEDVGNEYQGKSCDVSLVLSYNGGAGAVPGPADDEGGGSSLPPKTGERERSYAFAVIFVAGTVLTGVYVLRRWTA